MSIVVGVEIPGLSYVFEDAVMSFEDRMLSVTVK